MASPRSSSRGRWARIVEIGVDNSLLVVLVAALGTMLLGLAPQIFVGDSWMTLVAGREIVDHGLPHRESLTVLAHGRTWVDQQWLAQLAFYGAYLAAGLRATMLLHVALVTTATALAIGAARQRGATARSTLLVVSACLLVAPWSWTLRAQALALPLFVATLALLASDRDLLRRRTLLVFPLLVVWANVHGSVVVGAAIAGWAGAIGLGELALRRSTRARAWRSSALVVFPWLCVVATPYGTAVIGYYKLMFIDSPVAKAVTEWQSPRPHGYQIAFFVVAAVTLVIAFFGRRRLSLFDLGVLAFTLAGSLRSARGIVWFALAVSVLLPVALDAVLPPDRAPIRPRLGLALCIGSCVLLGTALAAVGAPRRLVVRERLVERGCPRRRPHLARASAGARVAPERPARGLAPVEGAGAPRPHCLRHPLRAVDGSRAALPGAVQGSPARMARGDPRLPDRGARPDRGSAQDRSAAPAGAGRSLPRRGYGRARAAG